MTPMDDQPLSVLDGDHAVTVSPTESPDWGRARVQRSVLMTPSADWIQSVFSCRFEHGGRTFIAPNRDYPYEGLTVYQDGENWKLVDCLALGFEGADGGELSKLRPLPVRITPWRVTYGYGLPELAAGGREPRVLVTYYLFSAGPPDLATGCVELHFPDDLGDQAAAVPILRPMIDIRHMYGSSDFGSYRLRLDEDVGGAQRIDLGNRDRSVCLLSAEGVVRPLPAPALLRWWHKLGTGSRYDGEDEGGRPATLFRGEEKWVAAFFDLRLPAVSVPRIYRLYFAGGIGDRPAGWSLADAAGALEQSRRSDDEDRARLERIVGPWQKGDPALHAAIVGRLAGVTKFKIRVRAGQPPADVLVPYAGAWWFKTPWYRDVFEGILSSFEVLMQIPEEREHVRRTVLVALGEQEPVSGRIPNKIPEFSHHKRSYAGSDATLLCLIVGHRWAERYGDREFAAQVAAATAVALDAFRRATAEPPRADGPPRIDRDTGLLLSPPHHSWIDTRSQTVALAGREVGGLPSRVSAEFVRRVAGGEWGEGTATALAELFSAPRFFLPEINAQWIVMLRGLVRILDLFPAAALGELRVSAEQLLRRAEASFLDVFWNPAKGFLHNLVFEDATTPDELECEAAVTAAAMLGYSVFSRDKLSAIWRCAEERLLVRRRLVELGDGLEPLGLLTRNDRRGVFYGDDEYHADVVWPRSTPYLIALLRLLGEEATIRGLLRSALDHQMSEGAVFYNHELLARPCGNNPRPDPRTADNPVPVKNPVQFWSQWCDPFLDSLASGGRR